jgi:hypothetical protein
MKKIIVTLTVLLNFIISANSQLVHSVNKKFFAAVSGGVGIPVGLFGSKNVDPDSEAGLAKLGYNLNIHSGYQIQKDFGLASTIFFSAFNVDKGAIDKLTNGSSSSISVDHWQYWGISAGPMATYNINKDFILNIKTLIGYSRANMPQIFATSTNNIVNSTNATPDKWTDAFIWQFGTDIRYRFGKNAFIFSNVDYNYQRPRWKYNVIINGTNQNVDLKQNMAVIDLDLGIGLEF